LAPAYRDSKTYEYSQYGTVGLIYLYPTKKFKRPCCSTASSNEKALRSQYSPYQLLTVYSKIAYRR
jgi:hypothetical protein